MKTRFTDKLVEDLEEFRVKQLQLIDEKEREIAGQVKQRAVSWLETIKGFEVIRDARTKYDHANGYIEINKTSIPIKSPTKQILLKLKLEKETGENTFLYRLMGPLFDFGAIFRTDNQLLQQILYHKETSFGYHNQGGRDLYQPRGNPNLWIWQHMRTRDQSEAKIRALSSPAATKIDSPILIWMGTIPNERDVTETGGGWGDDIITYKKNGKPAGFICGLNVDYKEVQEFCDELDKRLNLGLERSLW